MTYLLSTGPVHGKAFLLIVALLGGALLTSCTYGPSKIRTTIENARAKPDSHSIAVSVTYRQFRDPTGVNTFPNGGVAKILDEKAKIYLCDIDTLKVRRVACVSPADRVRSGWQPWILGWAGDNLFFKVSGRAGTDLKDFQDVNTVIYRVDPDGKVSEIAEPPKNIVYQNNTGPLPVGLFVRISKGHDTIDVQTETLEDLQTLFKIEDAEGELVPLEEPNN